MPSLRYVYLKDIPASAMFKLRQAVSIAESSDPNGAWVLLANSANYSQEEISRIKAMGNTRFEWTNTFFDSWLLRLPTLETVVHAVIDVPLYDAVDILEPLCSGDALQYIQQWRHNQEQTLELQLPPPSPTPEFQQPANMFLNMPGSLIISHRENPHGVEVTLPQPVCETVADDEQMTSCLNDSSEMLTTGAEVSNNLASVNAATPAVVLRQSAVASARPQAHLRISWKMGNFNHQSVWQLQLVTDTDESRAAATRLLDLHQRLSHPHLAPLLGSCNYGGSLDLYFPHYVCSLEEAYCLRGTPNFPCPMDFESRLLVLFGVAKALLYLHGSEQSGQRFLLGTLTSSSVKLDHFWRPAICDLTQLREVAAEADAFQPDVIAFKTLSIETLTGFSHQQDVVDFAQVINEINRLVETQPEERSQFVLDSEILLPDEIRPDESVLTSDTTGENERRISFMYFRYQMFLCLMHSTAGIRSMQDLADLMKHLSHFRDLWYTF